MSTVAPAPAFATALELPPGPGERVPTPSQRRAIEGDPGPMLVLAGPGAGKTYCLTERIRFLIERHGVDPARICAFTFTNKAAGEIAHRLEARLGDGAHRITGGTIHAFCANILRELGARVLLEPGFGIADEEYQLRALRRLEGPRRWHRSTLNRFSAHRFRGDRLSHDDFVLFERYEKFLHARGVVDFDTLVLRAAELLGGPDAPAAIRQRWDVILVDEFQDLNPVQYRVVRALARDHGHVFAVGDDEQSIYSWAGADPTVFRSFAADFEVQPVHLEENWRCPGDVFALARTLVTINAPLFGNRVVPRAGRESAHPVRALDFGTDEDEARWLIDDIRRDRDACGHRWGEIALLYRKHEIGQRLEIAFLNAGIPCRLATGRALSEDHAVAYVLAAARVIAHPGDDVCRDELLRVMLPTVLYDEAMARAEAAKHDLHRQLQRMAAERPRGDEQRQQIRRALADFRNLRAVGRRHTTLLALVQDLLSRRVGALRSVLDDRHDELTDPASLPDVVALANRLRAVRARHGAIGLPALGGAEIPIQAMLDAVGVRALRVPWPPSTTDAIGPDDVPSVGLALGVFKACQLIEMHEAAAPLLDFTAVDIETSDRDPATTEVIEIAAVRVRGGAVVDRFRRLVKPKGPISPAASEVHGVRAQDVVNELDFAAVWPKFHAFCGSDVVIAHNGYHFDFPVLARQAREAGRRFELCTYDTLPLARDLFTTSCKLGNLARRFNVALPNAHRALDDSEALAQIVLALDLEKQRRARITALPNLLDHLGAALALTDDGRLPAEALVVRHFTRVFALGRHSNCLEHYEREHGGDLSLVSVEELIDRLGGPALLVKVRAEKTADDRYPSAMARLRRLIAAIPEGPLPAQLSLFLERTVLSKLDGQDEERMRVNLLTLHSTKGLEFSRVYVVGAEDGELPGGSPTNGPTKEELEEARRLLYVGMTRTVDRLVLTRAATRDGKPTGGHRFLDEMRLVPEQVAPPPA